MTFNTSAVAVCCSRASASSRVRALTCSCRPSRVGLTGRAAAGALLRLGLGRAAVPRFRWLRLMVRRRLAEPCTGPTTLSYHITRFVVHHGRIRCRWQLASRGAAAAHVRFCSDYRPDQCAAATLGMFQSEYQRPSTDSLRLDVRRLDDRPPFLD